MAATITVDNSSIVNTVFGNLRIAMGAFTISGTPDGTETLSASELSDNKITTLYTVLLNAGFDTTNDVGVALSWDPDDDIEILGANGAAAGVAELVPITGALTGTLNVTYVAFGY